MDTDWCPVCGQKTADGNLYCSEKCKSRDGSVLLPGPSCYPMTDEAVVGLDDDNGEWEDVDDYHSVNSVRSSFTSYSTASEHGIIGGDVAIAAATVAVQNHNGHYSIGDNVQHYSNNGGNHHQHLGESIQQSYNNINGKGIAVAQPNGSLYAAAAASTVSASSTTTTSSVSGTIVNPSAHNYYPGAMNSLATLLDGASIEDRFSAHHNITSNNNNNNNNNNINNCSNSNHPNGNSLHNNSLISQYILNDYSNAYSSSTNSTNSSNSGKGAANRINTNTNNANGSLTGNPIGAISGIFIKIGAGNADTFNPSNVSHYPPSYASNYSMKPQKLIRRHSHDQLSTGTMKNIAIAAAATNHNYSNNSNVHLNASAKIGDPSSGFSPPNQSQLRRRVVSAEDVKDEEHARTLAESLRFLKDYAKNRYSKDTSSHTAISTTEVDPSVFKKPTTSPTCSRNEEFVDEILQQSWFQNGST